MHVLMKKLPDKQRKQFQRENPWEKEMDPNCVLQVLYAHMISREVRALAAAAAAVLIKEVSQLKRIPLIASQ